MQESRNDIPLGQFAKKHVISLPKEASIAESIRLMYHQLIRHIPVIDNNEIIGVINPQSIIDLITDPQDEIDFNDDVITILSHNYQVVSSDFPLFNAVKLISQDPSRIIVIEEDQSLIGIFTDIDILDIDFLWLNISDHPVTTTDNLGTEILFDGSTSIDMTVYQAMQFLSHTHREYVTLTEGSEIRGIIDFLGILHHLYYYTYRMGKLLEEVLEHPLYAIFPSSGVWYKEPVLLSTIRKEFSINDIYYGIIMDGTYQGKRVVSVQDIVSFLVNNSDYFPDESIS